MYWGSYLEWPARETSVDHGGAVDRDIFEDIFNSAFGRLQHGLILGSAFTAFTVSMF